MARVTVRKLRVKIERVPGLQHFLVLADLQGQFALQHVNKLDAGMLVDVNFLRSHGFEFREVGVEFAVGGQKIEGLEVKGGLFQVGRFRKAQTVFFSSERESVPQFFIIEKVFESDAENQRDARKRRERGIQLAVLEFGKQSGRKPGVAAEFDEAHLAAKTQLLQLVTDVVMIKSFFQMLGNHGEVLFSP